MTGAAKLPRIKAREFGILLSGALLLAGIHTARASVCFDPFANATSANGTAYSAGDFLFKQTSALGATWFALTNTPSPPASGFPVIVPGSLAYPGLPAGDGNCLSIPAQPGVMGRLTLGFAVTSGEAYFSFLLKVTDLSAVNASGTQNNFFAGFGDTLGNQNAALLRAVTKIYTRRSGNGFNLGVARHTHSPAQWVFDPTVRNLNDVLFIVGSYNYNNHTANLWINPSSATFGVNTAPPPTITATGGADLNANGIRAFVLGCYTNAPPGCLVDELRVGTSWAFVTGAPGIAVQPASQSLSAGETAVFSVTAVGGLPLMYRWSRNGVELSDGSKISGANTATLTINDVSSAEMGAYRVRIFNSYGAVTSAVATLTVNDPSILSQPRTLVLPLGTNAVFQVVADGSGPLSYQWFKDDALLVNGGNISGANAATLTLNSITEADAGEYRVRVMNASGDSVFSETAELFTTSSTAAAPRPNIIFVLCDDLGYGDLGVLFQNTRAPGLPRHATPNLDSLASEGMQLRQHYCGAPVCAPSRASLLLGVHQGHANVRNQQWDKALANNHTLATVLKRAGYETAAIGKWGLAGDDVGGTTPAEWAAYPTRRGFDYFFGYVRHSDGHEHYPKEAINSSRSKECYDGTNNISAMLDRCYTTDLFTARAKKWIQDQHASQPERPFFLYLAYDTPHAAYELPTQAYPAGGGVTGGMQWLGAPGNMINTASGVVDSFVHPDYATATYDHDNNPATPEISWPEIYKRFATSVRRIDEAMGDLKKLLQDLAIDTNTLVIFTSDNGPTPEDYLDLIPRYEANFFDTFGPFDGLKRDLWEGGVRMPALARWPAKIPPGSISFSPSQFHDWLPTFCELAGLPAPARTDGVSLVPTFTTTGTQLPGTIYVEYDDPNPMPTYAEFQPSRRGRVRNQMQLIRLNGLQGVRYDIGSHADDFEIYDVTLDPKQLNNLALNPAYAGVQQQMKDRVLRLRRPDATSPRPYDNELIPSVSVAPVTLGVRWSAFLKNFPWVPELKYLSSDASGTINQPTLAVLPRQEDVGVLFEGYLLAPANGDYTFYLSTDAGALLRIHEAIVVDADFGYSGGEVSGTIKLAAGLHPFRLYYARGNGGLPALNFSWSGPGFGKQPVPEAAFRREGVSVPTPPLAQDDFGSTAQGTSVSLNVLANDLDDGAPAALFLVGVGQPAAGVAVANGSQIVYTPNPGFLGEDEFTYMVSDGQFVSTGRVRVKVFYDDGSYWFPFNQNSGLTTEEAGGGTSATLIGFENDPAQWVEGKFNRALQFDGVADHVRIDGFRGITGKNPRTVSAWIKTTESARSIGIVSWGDLPSGNKWSLLVQNTTEPKGTLRLELGFGNTIAATPVNDGQWHHVACVLENLPSPTSSDVTFYVDGQLDAVVGGAFVSINTVALDEVLIGTDIQNRWFNGVIDEVRIFDRALSGAEIAALYDSQTDSALAWHRRFFGNATVNWNADDDGDGVTRLGEYSFGGQPHIADAQALRIIPELVANQVQLRFRRRISGSSEVIYQLQSSDDLVNWSDVAGTEILVTPSALPGFEEVVFRANAFVTNLSPFYVRLTARLP